ncbi:hypothetical protein STSP2_02391 [Anaerohalosphaera lusitana]|uniref:Uncharacterized protein n=1 Tax=Anaerohalosphaera lusitana TaxID=1936003 RepID=A0A1U9NN88_9BACT|nr:hypothetical protein [Anaerohalosphaera lusitana]AQT69204.1 hypothetical protein STSP2_02391 [Anaerohalosphaera lusitana]
MSLSTEKIERLLRMVDADQECDTVYAQNITHFLDEDEIAECERDQLLLFTGYSEYITCTQCFHQPCTVSPKILRYPDGSKWGVCICGENERLEFPIDQLRCWDLNITRAKELLPTQKDDEQATAKGPNKQTAKKKKRPNQKEMADRNRAVALAAAELKSKYGRLPTVSEVAAETSYEPKHIYPTDPYKEGKIAKKTSKATKQMTGSSVTSSELFGRNSLEQSRANRRSKSDQAHLEALINEQIEDENSDFVK